MVIITPQKLRNLNIITCLIQIFTGATILGINDANAVAPWYTFFSSTSTENSSFYVPNPKKVASIPIGIYSGIFLLLSGVNHLFSALPGKTSNVYNANICKNANPYRWIEYSVSAALMRVMIGQLSGITDIHLLFAIFGLTTSTMLFGWLMEVLNGERLPTYELSGNPKEVPSSKLTSLGDTTATTDTLAIADSPSVVANVDFLPFWFGCIPHLFAWAIIFCYFFVSLSTGDPPAFVWAIIFVMFFLDLMFAVNQYLQFKQKKWFVGYGKAEFGYILLSLTAKQLLAWVTYGGTMRFADQYQG